MNSRGGQVGGDRSTADRRTRESGITLIEVVVSMSIMSVLMAMFTVGILQMFRSANESESLSTAQAQLNTVFLRLDTEIRYATSINTPGSVGADFYVEYLTASAGARTCTQLRVQTADRLLQLRTWPQGSPAQATAWRVLASGVSADPGQAPFTMDPVTGSPYERLRLRLVAAYGSRNTAKTQLDIAFTALNTVTPHQNVCGEGRP